MVGVIFAMFLSFHCFSKQTKGVGDWRMAYYIIFLAPFAKMFGRNGEKPGTGAGGWVLLAAKERRGRFRFFMRLKELVRRLSQFYPNHILTQFASPSL